MHTSQRLPIGTIEVDRSVLLQDRIRGGETEPLARIDARNCLQCIGADIRFLASIREDARERRHGRAASSVSEVPDCIAAVPHGGVRDLASYDLRGPAAVN